MTRRSLLPALLYTTLLSATAQAATEAPLVQKDGVEVGLAWLPDPKDCDDALWFLYEDIDLEAVSPAVVDPPSPDADPPDPDADPPEPDREAWLEALWKRAPDGVAYTVRTEACR